MNFSEVYNALQLNTLDGQENPIDVPYSNKFYEVQKYISGTDHMADAWLVGINSKLYDSLSDKQQEAITKAGEEVQQWNVEFMEKEDQKALDTLKKTVWNTMTFQRKTVKNLLKFLNLAMTNLKS